MSKEIEKKPEKNMKKNREKRRKDSLPISCICKF